MSQRLTDAARSMLTIAGREAASLGQPTMSPAHVLLGTLVEGSSVTASVLLGYGVTPTAARARLAKLQPPVALTAGPSKFSPATEDVMRAAIRRATTETSGAVHVDTIALCTLTSGDAAVDELLITFGTTAASAAETVAEHLAGTTSTPGPTPTRADREVPSGDANGPYNHEAPVSRAGAMAGPSGLRRPEPLRAAAPPKALAQFGLNLTDEAAHGRLDPVTGRDRELEQLFMVLCRRTKSNPVLVGEAGVGKTAVVEGLAARIAAGTVPEPLQGKQIWSLDMGGLMAGTSHRGDFEERIRAIVEDASRDDVILFIDEIHTLTNAGRSGSQTMGAANLLKPALARGQVSVIGATTLDEYRIIESDAALERRFASVRIDAPSRDVTVAILERLRASYESHHRVRFTDAALRAAVDLSVEHLPERQLPDKAIDCIDEAGAAAAIRRGPLDAEQRALFDQLAELDGDNDDVERAAVLMELEDAGALTVVDTAQIAAVVADWAGVPVAAVSDAEADRLLDMESFLRARVVGQDDALSAVSRAVRRRRSGIGDRTRPSSFLFAGPSGVGKTETSKALAEFLFGDESKMVTIDMSEYMEQHSVARLIGAPPGYAGHDDPGQLTEAVRRNPGAVVLFDEIEKAHPQVLDILLALLEEGHVTDAHGTKIDFSRTIVVMTSNLGAELLKQTRVGFGSVSAALDAAERARLIGGAVRDALRPELLNRIDEVVCFDTLSSESVSTIAELLLGRVRSQLGERNVTIELTPAAVGFLVAAGWDPLLGARPLRRALQVHVENRLSEGLLDGSVRDGDHVVVDFDGTTVTVTRTVVPVPAAAPVVA